MKRSAGITASAVICFAGSALSILIAIFMLVTVMLPGAPGGPVPTPGILAAVIVIHVIYLGFGIWGIISGVGLLRLRNWARICFAVFGGILCFFSLSGALGLVVGIFAIPQMPQTQNVPQGLMIGVFAAMAVAGLLCAALGIFWMIYFNRSGVKSQFQGAVLDGEPPAVPLSMRIIAWSLIIGGVSIPFFLLTRFPVEIFGFVVPGAAGRALYVLLAVVGLAAGIGILKKRVHAHSLAVGYFAFGLLNTLSYLVIPGAAARMQTIMQEAAAGQPMPVSAGIIMVPSLLFTIVPLWFLIARRRMFIERCSRGL